MDHGVVEQVGSPAEIYDLPRNAFVADFVGSANLIRGRHRPDLSREGSVVLETAGGALVHGTACRRPPVGAEPVLSVRTVHVRIEREAAAASVNVWPATIRRRVFQGDFTQYHVDWEGRQAARRAPRDRGAAGRGRAGVSLSVEPRHCVLLEN